MARATLVPNEASIRWRTIPWHVGDAHHPPVDEFFFEERVRLTESEFVALRRIRPPSRKSVASWAVIGCACLFWGYTVVLGIVILAGAAFAATTSWIGPWSAKQAWRENDKHLQAPIVFGISHREIWRRSEGIHVRFAWARLSGWRIIDGWLQLASICGGVAYLRMESLERAGVQEAVLECIRQVEEAEDKG